MKLAILIIFCTVLHQVANLYNDCINKDMKSVKDKLLIDNVFAYLSGKYISPTINNY